MLNDPIDTTRLFLHVLAASIWVGGQLTLLGLLPVLRAAGGDLPKQAARAYNKIAWPSFWILVATGVWNYAADARTATHAWKVTVIIKVAVVVVSGATAWLHAHATSRRALAVNGALAGLSALGALLIGIVLAG